MNSVLSVPGQSAAGCRKGMVGLETLMRSIPLIAQMTLRGHAHVDGEPPPFGSLCAGLLGQQGLDASESRAHVLLELRAKAIDRASKCSHFLLLLAHLISDCLKAMGSMLICCPSLSEPLLHFGVGARRCQFPS